MTRFSLPVSSYLGKEHQVAESLDQLLVETPSPWLPHHRGIPNRFLPGDPSQLPPLGDPSQFLPPGVPSEYSSETYEGLSSIEREALIGNHKTICSSTVLPGFETLLRRVQEYPLVKVGSLAHQHLYPDEDAEEAETRGRRDKIFYHLHSPC
ncbi:hypothetical protein M413DRAFT_145152 [Hebeloma cylindrosporum]|uniref:Uncharacterized protein n=1 Tax=Hebeloma cylindrosporum TaxID=76867 RepID=A0A0C3CCC7_HEBCY|nr:hypothetical protein M413DRAFT_145152 [Hebeloma cylindrosporum h7]